MKIKNILLVVTDIETSKNFYKELFGMTVIKEFQGKVMFLEGLVLQEQTIWEEYIDKDIRFGGNQSELYFEVKDIDSFYEKLQESQIQIHYLGEPIKNELDKRLIRLYDLDKHIIEIGEIFN